MSQAHIKRRHYIPLIELLESRLVLDDSSAGILGVNSRFLTTPNGTALDGTGAAIGMVEIFRPRRDHSDMTVAGAFVVDRPAPLMAEVDEHATAVAGVMVVDGVRDKGISNKAALFGSAFRQVDDVTAQSNAILASQFIANQRSGPTRVVALNHSYNSPALPKNYTSLISQGLDWVSTSQQILNVIARGNGRQSPTGPERFGAPADSFNGIIVGATQTRLDPTGVEIFQTFAAHPVNTNGNARDSTTGRNWAQIVAPGSSIRLPIVQPANPGDYFVDSGTSYAAPHVTATAAILQQYSLAALAAGAVGWEGNSSLKPEVLKAVILNSVDKRIDLFINSTHEQLDMEKTIFKSDGESTYPRSNDQNHPLDFEIGVGQLNVRRAINQYGSGNVVFKNADGTPRAIPAIGWSAGSLPAGTNQFAKFVFERPPAWPSKISITLTWNVDTALVDSSGRGRTAGMFDAGESFTPSNPANLDLFLLPRNATNINQAIWSSRSTAYNVEHLYTDVPGGDLECGPYIMFAVF